MIMQTSLNMTDRSSYDIIAILIHHSMVEEVYKRKQN